MQKFTVKGMMCAACSAHVEKAVRQTAGVTDCAVNLLTGDLTVEGDAAPSAVIKSVTKAGYGCKIKKDAISPEAQNEKDEKHLLLRLVSSCILLALLMILSMGHMLSIPLPDLLADRPLLQGYLQLILSAVILLVNGRFFLSGTKVLFRLSPNMDTLVAMGAGAAFFYSGYLLFDMTLAARSGETVAHHLHGFYFESAAMIVTLITVGKLLEARAKGKTTSALKGLISLAPKMATVLRDGEETTIPAEQVTVGDVFLVRPGETVPVDGTVLDGTSAVDEASLTGESIPSEKAVGSPVYAGTVNQLGFLRCSATSVGQDTTLSRIIQLVSDTAATKAPIAKVADRISAIFVPCVMGVALLTLAVWLLVGQTVGFALARGISVLVISCPCALGLATPVAIMVGSGVGARAGILFKTAAALEVAGRIDTLALDKTGTLTEGKPTVCDVLPTSASDETALLSLAYALEKKSEHPLSRAICACAEERGIPQKEVNDFSAIVGKGLTGTLDGVPLRAGNLSFVSESVPIPDDAREIAQALADEGKTVMFFASGGEFSGMIAVSDPVKEDSAEAIARLHKMGIRTVMLTGDNERTAKAIANVLGIDEVRAGILPQDKANEILLLQKSGRKVAMVGDGINDAPALTIADLGIAVGKGTDIAIDSADTVLVKNDTVDIPAAIRLGRATLHNIHQNLFFAFIYNVIGIPLAAGVFIHLFGWELNPMFGAAAMSLSSFCVVTNALRLNRTKLK